MIDIALYYPARRQRGYAESQKLDIVVISSHGDKRAYRRTAQRTQDKRDRRGIQSVGSIPLQVGVSASLTSPRFPNLSDALQDADLPSAP
ncbi:hypothetical protein [Sphingobium sp.]|uniref:hypothetical protein n=1 Tax=Sphingobium sp. TaxID=1912891 RepID=UPI0029BFEE0E|nr:hypothetical protein [Sphingobium sp.]